MNITVKFKKFDYLVSYEVPIMSISYEGLY